MAAKARSILWFELPPLTSTRQEREFAVRTCRSGGLVKLVEAAYLVVLVDEDDPVHATSPLAGADARAGAPTGKRTVKVVQAPGFEVKLIEPPWRSWTSE